jgi:hypothetical protein
MTPHKLREATAAINPLEVLGVCSTVLSRAVLQSLLAERGETLYWRCLTPLVVLWGLIYQRLQADHSCDGGVSHLLSGAADGLDPADPHRQPLSQRLRSESNAAYVQARQRLPLALVQASLTRSYQAVVTRWQQASAYEAGWKGHAVRVLDGTTIRLRPVGDLASSYTRSQNQHGPAYWLVARVVGAFCLWSEAVVALAEGAWQQSEPALAGQLMAADPLPNSLYLGDQGFGVYRVVQCAQAVGQQVLLRLERDRARSLWRANHAQPLVSGSDRLVVWEPGAKIQSEPTLARTAVVGRLLYQRLEQPGFRPLDLYLFTTLLDETHYPADELVALYGRRQRVEVELRDLKQTLALEQLEVKSADLFRKELWAGCLAYNLLRHLMLAAATQAGLSVTQLSFKRCWRRLRDLLGQGLPRWVLERASIYEYVLARLAACRLPQQPGKVRYEPRRVRRKPSVYPALHGTRAAAREQLLAELAP